MNTKEENKDEQKVYISEWKVYAGAGALIALFMFIFFYSSAYIETERQSNARTAKGVVIEKNFAPGQGIAGVSSSGSYGVGSTADRYIVAVKATEGASGLKEIDVNKSVYYRLSVGSEVKLIITKGDLGEEGKYRVEIDPASIPAQPASTPSAEASTDRSDVPNGKGQIRK